MAMLNNQMVLMMVFMWRPCCHLSLAALQISNRRNHFFGRSSWTKAFNICFKVKRQQQQQQQEEQEQEQQQQQQQQEQQLIFPM